MSTKGRFFIALTRIALGSIFLWAFFDKLFGLRYATQPDKSWLAGFSPTFGFLKFGTHGPFKTFFESLAGNPVVDWFFMLGLLGVGICLVLGIARKISTLSATIMLFLMYLALFPPQNHPFIDDHIIYILVLQILFGLHSGEIFGLGTWWNNTTLVKRFSFLK